VPRYLDAEDLIDAHGVAALLDLPQPNTVSAYERRYPAMPRPVVNLRQERCKRWVRSKIKQWRADRLASTGR
jgi:predicted DNA-binding transcriptional regulator AlpA